MIRKNTLHILNGQEMYNYFKKTHFLEQEWMIPFNEAMCYGNTCDDLFSQKFVEMRAKVHQVTQAQYAEITLKPLDPLFREDFTRIALWFDLDMFCQINLLTILAWLDQKNHKGRIDLHIVGDKFEPVDSFKLKANGYYQFYKQVLIHKTLPKYIHPAPLKKGVELYLNYLNKESDLLLYIQKHQNVPEKELVPTLIEKFKDYGLGDTQYFEIIKSHRKTTS
ncbi:AraC family transcriptional regulator [Neobacillus bataviensis]|uniref:AraC family transcriptional regulator n=1 Tax=Neobacillus bataviensis TaxID=220685 RepID=UPI001CBB5DF7|nr:AraC family transcriptional regulator [Neobacillus bataviensis]